MPQFSTTPRALVAFATVLGALALGGCGLIEAHDGPTREDFEQARAATQDPQQSESAATAEDVRRDEVQQLQAPEQATSDVADEAHDVDLEHALVPVARAEER